jgi:rhodanese-related sulfurtransferase
MSGDKKIDLTYQDLLDVKAQGGVILVDVREHNEIQETGKLPDSIHIPRMSTHFFFFFMKI